MQIEYLGGNLPGSARRVADMFNAYINYRCHTRLLHAFDTSVCRFGTALFLRCRHRTANPVLLVVTTNYVFPPLLIPP